MYFIYFSAFDHNDTDAVHNADSVDTGKCDDVDEDEDGEGDNGDKGGEDVVVVDKTTLYLCVYFSYY